MRLATVQTGHFYAARRGAVGPRRRGYTQYSLTKTFNGATQCLLVVTVHGSGVAHAG